MDMGSAVDVLARTIWGEARGDGRTGMEAVACVVLNRAAHPRWWGREVRGVCLAPWQFSCWNGDDPNLPKMRAASGATPMFAAALLVAQQALAGDLVDPTGGADSYFAVGTPTPSWADPAAETLVILHHRFFRLELPAPADAATLGNVSMHAPSAPAIEDPADALNEAELVALAQAGA